MIGIYQILNKKTNDFYIGSSIDIEKRWKTHQRDLCKKIHLDNVFKKSRTPKEIQTLCFML